jgi:glycosyltransferase involved in cell wall biosynthesis
LNTDGFNFFIQQHVDPISVSPQTIHIVRLHDILPITHPFYFSKKARWAFSRGLNTLLKDPKIIWVTDTLATKKEFVDFYGRHLKVEVIPCEVGFGFKLEHIYESINKKHKESSDGKNIFLCVNTIEPRKNVEIVVQAFLCAQEKVPKNRKDQLIIVGKYGWLEEVLISKLRTNFFGPNIIFIEDIDDRELQEWYEKANFLVSASAAEGFGLPPLEGMLFGCIPIVSSLEQHRETIEEYGIFFDIDKKLLSEALMKAKSMSSEEKAAMGFKVHDYVKNKYSRESLKTRWEELLVRLQMEPT